ncbi:hypothetical protein [Streptomyces acidiscabies]|uniref:Uncharacterized protein n=1 Tax=Streptomyces acidiscabies TaxID=42234 RepID=A0AAP6BEH5_9ACTN|nr:hypothetical protein [Streptomyces acidiscabies]MBP5941869.1 hypothetical protein [Streptomyces sp. LBUM 1476]MBZ3913304.1 hypothetical protein [Streptomyces acidiscabies]MDX2963270.1 hypothetical protein [Streptomyces acidiscabies]MDX3021512.1 hypothetical protein [Streptomyces acidiscabies]MDX3790271.1 hypothetical protein [Streptomyces acidiscabies]
MPAPCDPAYAPIGDVSTALMMIDSRLKTLYSGRTTTDPEQQELIDQYTASISAQGARDVLDGACTLIYMYMKWLRLAHAEHDRDVIEYVVPSLVATLRQMTQNVRPEAIPTMVGLVISSAMELSPSLWRQQYGQWTQAEMVALEATVMLLAEHINRVTDDRDFATRLITDALSRAEEGELYEEEDED